MLGHINGVSLIVKLHKHLKMTRDISDVLVEVFQKVQQEEPGLKKYKK